MFAEIATALASEGITSLVKRVLTEQETQSPEVAGLNKDVMTLLQGPWRTSRFYLEDAYDAPNAGARTRALEAARQSLYEAVGLAPDGTRQKSIVAGDLTLVLALLNRKEDAFRWAVRAFTFAEEYAAAAASEAENEIRLRAFSIDDSYSLFQAWMYDVPGIFGWIWDPARAASTLGTPKKLRLLSPRLIPLLERGIEIPQDADSMIKLLDLPKINSFQLRVVKATLKMKAAKLLYEAHSAADAVRDFEALCAPFGSRPTRGHLRVTLSSKQEAAVRYESTTRALEPKRGTGQPKRQS